MYYNFLQDDKKMNKNQETTLISEREFTSITEEKEEITGTASPYSHSTAKSKR